MRPLTIRLKMTLWYAFFMLLLIAVSLILISDLSRRAMMTNQKENLIETVTDAINEIDGPGDFDYFENSVYLIVYDDTESFKKGIIPDDFPVLMPLLNDSVQTVESDFHCFYVYDRLVDRQDRSYWMRGVVPQSAPDLTGTMIVGFASGFLPVIVVLACAIGYFLTGRAFRPVKIIQETAQSIADSNKLYLRVGLPEGKDEVALLAKTVDHMLDKLENSFEKEKQFTSDVSHELRTPLTVILTESEYALQYGESSDDLKESMLVVNRQAERMSKLINQLLFFTRSDNGSLVIVKETFDVVSVVSELVQDYSVLAEADDIAITWTAGPHESLPVTADKLLFTRCLANLIQNAICYGRSGGHVTISIADRDGYDTITVADDGIGISSEDLPKIWNRFYRAEESRTKTKTDSMGLGLSMVKLMMEKHGGFVTVSSTPEVGSTFTLYIPQESIC